MSNTNYFEDTMPTKDQQIANLRAALLQRDCSLDYIENIQNGVIAEQLKQWVPLTTEQQTANAAAQ